MKPKLAALKPPVNHGIVEKLEELLELARAGTIQGFTCSSEIGGGMFDTYTDSRDLITVLGHLSRQIHIVHLALDKTNGDWESG